MMTLIKGGGNDLYLYDQIAILRQVQTVRSTSPTNSLACSTMEVNDILVIKILIIRCIEYSVTKTDPKMHLTTTLDRSLD